MIASRIKVLLSCHGGEQRKVAIASIIAMKPEILILDEPTVSLDPLSKKDILDRVKEYQKTTGSTVIIVSHDVNIIAEYTDKVLILDNGKIAKYDTVEYVFSETDELEYLGLELPDIAKIFHKLKAKGIPVRTDIYTAQEAKRELVKMLKR